jgi:hypothetical protein
MMKYLIAIITISCNFLLHAQEINPFYVGHSLVNHTMPHMVQALADNANIQTHYERQIIIGSPLKYNYDNASGAEGTPYTTAFPNGNFNTLVITEAVPLQNHLTWSDTYLYANNFYNYAKNNNNGVPIKFYIYESWHCINSGIPNSDPDYANGCAYDNSANSNILWHPRLLLDFPLWSGIVSHVRNENPSDDEIWMVPVGQAFYNLTTQINAGSIPGISSFRNLFDDDIHLTNAGNYFVACVMFATIFGQSPVGLTSNFNNVWGIPYDNMPTPSQAMAMQQVAWSTVTSLSTWTGVPPLATRTGLEMPMKVFSIYPNPASTQIKIVLKNFNENIDLQIYNSGGVLIKVISVKSSDSVDISDLPGGIYFVRLKDDPISSQKFLKF